MITGLYAGLYTLLLLGLGLNVVRMRRRHKVGLLDNGNIALRKAIRIHGNAVENLPMVLILMGVAEANQFNLFILHGCGITVLLCRIWHALGINKSTDMSKGRFWGTLGTWLVMVLLALMNISAYLITKS